MTFIKVGEPVTQIVGRGYNPDGTRTTATDIKIGDTAPDFELPSHLEKGKKVKLSDFRGKNNVVLAFYPLAWTPV